MRENVRRALEMGHSVEWVLRTLRYPRILVVSVKAEWTAERRAGYQPVST
jgi:hypothetical protein